MKIAAIVGNIILVGFTCVVTLTDGPPQGAAYVVLGLLLVLIPVLNVVAISRPSLGALMKIITVLSNVVLLGFACWAIIDQHPHPQEAGLLEFELLAVLIPLLSAAAAMRKGGGARRLSQQSCP